MGNTALNKNATSNMSVAPFTPDKAVNGKTSAFDRWVGTVPGWLGVDLGYTYWINQWTVKNMAVIADWDTYIMRDYRLEGSNDASNWYNVFQVSGNTSSTTQQSFNPVRFRYFRTYVTNGLAGNSGVSSIVDMELEEYNNSPYLSSLTVSAGSLSPAFYKQVFGYSVTVSENVNEINVTPTTTASNATITVNGRPVTNSFPSQNIAVNDGYTTITIVVTINNTNISETYTITVSKSISPYLDNLIVNDAILSEVFDPYITSYLAYVSSDTATVSVIAYTHTPGALININGKTYASGQETGALDLSENGNTLITVYVENATSRMNYEIEVQKDSE